jgi:hypothetical protein
VKEELTGPSLDVEESLGVVRNATASEAIAITVSSSSGRNDARSVLNNQWTFGEKQKFGLDSKTPCTHIYNWQRHFIDMYLLSGFNTDVINSQLNITKQYFQQLSES